MEMILKHELGNLDNPDVLLLFIEIFKASGTLHTPARPGDFPIKVTIEVDDNLPGAAEFKERLKKAGFKENKD